MNAQIARELIELSPAEKRELGEALIASAEPELAHGALSGEQRAELQARLAHHRSNPDERGITFQKLKAKPLSAAQ